MGIVQSAYIGTGDKGGEKQLVTPALRTKKSENLRGYFDVAVYIKRDNRSKGVERKGVRIWRTGVCDVFHSSAIINDKGR